MINRLWEETLDELEFAGVKDIPIKAKYGVHVYSHLKLRHSRWTRHFKSASNPLAECGEQVLAQTMVLLLAIHRLRIICALPLLERISRGLQISLNERSCGWRSTKMWQLFREQAITQSFLLFDPQA